MALIAAAVALRQNRRTLEMQARLQDQKIMNDRQEGVIADLRRSRIQASSSQISPFLDALAVAVATSFRATTLPAVYLELGPLNAVIRRHASRPVREWLDSMEALSDRRFALPLALDPQSTLSALELMAGSIAAARECIDAHGSALADSGDGQAAAKRNLKDAHERFVQLSAQLVAQITASLYAGSEQPTPPRGDDSEGAVPPRDALSDALLRSGVQSIGFAEEPNDPCWFAIWEIQIPPAGDQPGTWLLGHEPLAEALRLTASAVSEADGVIESQTTMNSSQSDTGWSRLRFCIYAAFRDTESLRVFRAWSEAEFRVKYTAGWRPDSHPAIIVTGI